MSVYLSVSLLINLRNVCLAGVRLSVNWFSACLTVRLRNPAGIYSGLTADPLPPPRQPGCLWGRCALAGLRNAPRLVQVPTIFLGP
jgi:hypothetical protein